MSIDLNENGFCVKNENEEVVFSINAFTDKDWEYMRYLKDKYNVDDKKVYFEMRKMLDRLENKQ